MKFPKDLQNALMILGIPVSVILWSYGTFATIKYADANYQRNRDDILELKSAVQRIDERTYEMNGRQGKPPVPIAEEM